MSGIESRLVELEQAVVELTKTVAAATRRLTAIEQTVAIILDTANKATRHAVARAARGQPIRLNLSEIKKVEALKEQLADAESELQAARVSRIGAKHIRLARIDGAKQRIERLRAELKKLE